MLEFDWENSISYWVCSTSHVLRRELSTRLAGEGVTLRQWEVLAWLSCKGCGSQAELAEYLGIEPPTLAGVLTRMERDGLLERKACNQDRRRNTIHPTEKAQAIWERATEICHQVRSRAIRGIPQADIELFKRVCGQIQANVSANGPVAAGKNGDIDAA